MDNRSFSSSAKWLMLSPPVFAAAVFTAALVKYRYGVGMTPIPEIFSLAIFLIVSAIVSILWAIRVHGCNKEPAGSDNEGQFRLAEVVLISRIFTGVFIAWNVFSLHYAWAVGGGVLYTQNRTGTGPMVPQSWSAVRAREMPQGRILSVRTSGVFVKPCVAGCIEAVSVRSSRIEEPITLMSPDGRGAAVKVSAYMQLVEDNEGLEDLALRVGNVQEELEMRAKSALRQCASQVFASGWSSPGSTFEMVCGQDYRIFQLVSPAISG